MMMNPFNRTDERKSSSQADVAGGSEAACTGAEDAAGELYRTASLLTGNQAQTVEILENVLDEVSADPCANSEAFRSQANSRLIEISIRRIAEGDPGAFHAPAAAVGEDEPCVDTDDLSAAGISHDEFVHLIESKQVGAGKTREWMENLPASLRVVFVLRAVLGEDLAVIASRLREVAGAGGAGWTEIAVRTVYRRALCLLASSLVATNPPLAVNS